MYNPLHFLQILTSITFFKNVIDVMICIECMLTNRRFVSQDVVYFIIRE